MHKKKQDKKQQAIVWLNQHAPHLKLLHWGGGTSLKSTFKDTNRNIEFQYEFAKLKYCINKNPNAQFGLTSNELSKRNQNSNYKKTYTKEQDVHDWLRNNLPNIKLIKWSGKATTKSKFLNQDNGNEFEQSFTKLKDIFKRKPNTIFGASKQEKAEQWQNTIQNKYNVDSPAQLETSKQKTKQTSLKKYGVENYSQTEEWRNKTKETNLQKYGYESVLQAPEIRKKVSKIAQNKTGIENPFYGKTHSKKTLDKIKKTNLKKYGCKATSSNPNIKKKAKITRIKNGTIKTINGKTLKDIAIEKNISESFAGALKRNYGDDFLLNYSKQNKKLEDTLQKILLEKQNLNIKNNEITFKERRFIPDLVFTDYNLIVECDGLKYHSDLYQKNDAYHVTKKHFYNKKGYKALFFRQDEIVFKIDITLSIILNKLKLNHKIHNRKLIFKKETNTNKAKKFLQNNHLMGNGSGRCYTLSDQNGNIYSILQVKWKDKPNKILEISRFCNKKYCSIYAAFSRLLYHVEEIEQPKQIITFIDERYGDGSYLKNLGFEKQNTHLSFRWTDFENTYHRMQYPKNSGYEYGLFKIWDCGQTKWSKTIKNPCKSRG